MDEIELSRIDVITDRGWILEDQYVSTNLNISKMSRSVRELLKPEHGKRFKESLKTNYTTHGKLFDSDRLWHLEISAVGDYKQIKRTYFTLLDALSNVGGLIEF